MVRCGRSKPLPYGETGRVKKASPLGEDSLRRREMSAQPTEGGAENCLRSRLMRGKYVHLIRLTAFATFPSRGRRWGRVLRHMAPSSEENLNFLRRGSVRGAGGAGPLSARSARHFPKWGEAYMRGERYTAVAPQPGELPAEWPAEGESCRERQQDGKALLPGVLLISRSR